MIELHSGAPDGPLLGSIEVPSTGAWDKFVEREIKITPPSKDRADIHAVFVKPGVANGNMDLDWIEFGKPK